MSGNPTDNPWVGTSQSTPQFNFRYGGFRGAGSFRHGSLGGDESRPGSSVGSKRNHESEDEKEMEEDNDTQLPKSVVRLVPIEDPQVQQAVSLFFFFGVVFWVTYMACLDGENEA